MQRIILTRILKWQLILIAVLAGPALAAGSVPTPDTDAAAWAKALYAAVTSKEWTVVTGLALVAVTYVMRRWVVGWVSWFRTPFGGLVLGFAVAASATLGTTLAAGAHVTLGLLAASLSTAAASAGIWEWLKDHIPGMQEAASKAQNTVRVNMKTVE